MKEFLGFPWMIFIYGFSCVVLVLSSCLCPSTSTALHFSWSSCFGNGPNTVSESTVSNIELSEFFTLTESGERTQWVPLSLLFACQCELTEFFAELTEFAIKISEAQLVLFSETVLSKQYSARFLMFSPHDCALGVQQDRDGLCGMKLCIGWLIPPARGSFGPSRLGAAILILVFCKLGTGQMGSAEEGVKKFLTRF